MTLLEIEERLRAMIDHHSEDEFNVVNDPNGLVDKVYELEQELIRIRLLGVGVSR